MSRRRARPAPVWGRGKMLALLAAAAVVALAAVGGLVWAAAVALHPATGTQATAGPPVSLFGAAENPTGPADSTGSPGAARPAGPTAPAAAGGAAARDALAARPMPAVDPAAARPAPVSTRVPPALALPAAGREGPAGLGVFGHTAAGALAQLAAIDQAAMQAGSLAGARTVLAGWGMPGGPDGSSWSLVHGLAALLTAAGLPGGGSPQLAVVATPLMGLVKGSVGPDFVLACVDFEMDVTLDATARSAAADCQRMVWNTGAAGGPRWMIGPGPEPADPPAVWPDTDAAIAVGYADLLPAGGGGHG